MSGLSPRPTTHASIDDAEPTMEQVVAEETRVLARVCGTLDRRQTRRLASYDYESELLALRDQINDARLEDIPPLVEEMERLQQVATRRAKVVQGSVDPTSPYFGRLVLEHDDRRREVLIGRSTYLDPKTGVRIVDWRDAPVSRIYYRYEEGDDFDEFFGGREVEGEVLVRRTLGINMGKLKRIGTVQGTYVCARSGEWRALEEGAGQLSGGQGSAARPEQYHRPGKLGVEGVEGREDRHLADITALIDAHQFDVITRPTTGLVVIQGGAGSGKTTIGLHRLAYLAFQEPKRFRADRMLVIVENEALVRYISRVLPALGVENVQVVTFMHWARERRERHLPSLPHGATEETPSVVVRFKKHPAMLTLIDRRVAELAKELEQDLSEAASQLPHGGRVLRVYEASKGRAIGERLEAVRHFLNNRKREGGDIPLGTRHTLDRLLRRMKDQLDVPSVWAELLTDLELSRALFAELAPDAFTPRELEWVHSWCGRRCGLVLDERDRRRDDPSRHKAKYASVDGSDEDVPRLDDEDDALLLRLHQRLIGKLRARRDVLSFEHVFVDEAQDLSPVEIATVVDTVSDGQSLTLAGDVAQRLHMDNGFTDWGSVLGQLGLDHVEIEPLRLSYRSTHEIFDFATDVLGHLKNEVVGQATRHGAPVELFRFSANGEAVAFLSQALRDLVRAEPLASIAVIARYPEQADVYYQGLVQGEVPNLRRIAEQDFPFRPGVDVTDVRQVKGLEFDYVVLIEVTNASYPPEDDARHLLHIAATRAAHQLWVTTTGSPAVILPEALREEL
ncbi:MAG: ATP-binding domain-containing protein [Deltaproteobacteria bacterium]|nr:ATP-binding domain-containing protein [Deltaproteobacteria bacterium]